MSDNLPPGCTQAMIDAAQGDPYDPIRQALVDHLGESQDAHETADALDAHMNLLRIELAALYHLAADGGARTIQAVQDRMCDLDNECADSARETTK